MQTSMKTMELPWGMAIALVLVAAPSVAHARTPPQDAAAGRVEEPAPPPAPTTAARPFEELDQNADGAIGKDEAAVDPPLAQVFGTLDKDADGRLTPEEYAVHVQGTP